MSIQAEINTLKSNALSELDVIQDLEALARFRSKYLGRNGLIRQITRKISTLSLEEKTLVGQLINELKNLLSYQVEQKTVFLQSVDSKSRLSRIDPTLPGEAKTIGRTHPIYDTITEINNIFLRLGFEIAYGPEIETEYYNFTALNIPSEHPARDAFDTFYLDISSKKDDKIVGDLGRWLLRSHTSPVQIHVMKSRQPPFQVIMPGKVFRPDTPSPSRFPMFHQVEGLMVGENITFAHLKGVLDIFCREFFGPEIKMRFRPSFFPFTEPSAEVDISCVICRGTGRMDQKIKDSENELQHSKSSFYCNVCRGDGWLEILGSGMVHPAVFEAVGYDPEKYTGFAFGMGVERMAMLKNRISDIRLFTENHIGFLSQF